MLWLKFLKWVMRCGVICGVLLFMLGCVCVVLMLKLVMFVRVGNIDSVL